LEDWEFWVAFAAVGVHFFYLNKTTFKYRVSKKSMIGIFTNEMAEETKEYVAKKHSSLYRYHYCKSVTEYINITNKLKHSKRFVFNAFCEVFFNIKFK
jgi:hypothetical protein